jgi:uncharacterized protein YlzI (FlbEa/FlbD family)
LQNRHHYEDKTPCTAIASLASAYAKEDIPPESLPDVTIETLNENDFLVVGSVKAVYKAVLNVENSLGIPRV